jgi:hypothetical protein
MSSQFYHIVLHFALEILMSIRDSASHYELTPFYLQTFLYWDYNFPFKLLYFIMDNNQGEVAKSEVKKYLYRN